MEHIKVRYRWSKQALRVSSLEFLCHLYRRKNGYEISKFRDMQRRTNTSRETWVAQSSCKWDTIQRITYRPKHMERRTKETNHSMVQVKFYRQHTESSRKSTNELYRILLPMSSKTGNVISRTQMLMKEPVKANRGLMGTAEYSNPECQELTLSSRNDLGAMKKHLDHMGSLTTKANEMFLKYRVFIVLNSSTINNKNVLRPWLMHSETDQPVFHTTT